MNPDTAIKTAQAIQDNPVTSIITVLICAVLTAVLIIKLSGNRKREIAELRTEVNTLTAPVAEQKNDMKWMKGTNNTQDGFIARIDDRSKKNKDDIREIKVEQKAQRILIEGLGDTVKKLDKKIEESISSTVSLDKTNKAFVESAKDLLVVYRTDRDDKKHNDNLLSLIAEKLGIETNDK